MSNIIPLRGPDGGNSSGAAGGGDMWQQSVETRLSELRADIGLLRDDMTVRFDAVDRKFDQVGDKVGKLDEKRERDFRLSFGALIAVALGLAGLMAKGFHWIG